MSIGAEQWTCQKERPCSTGDPAGMRATHIYEGANAMRRDIEFNADGLTLRGWLYLPDGATKPVSTVVMAHGFSCLKEMFLDKYAETFAAAGFGVLVYDNPNFADSDGLPRQEVDPWGQIHDYRHAITYASSLPEVDADRLGIWRPSDTAGPR